MAEKPLRSPKPKHPQRRVIIKAADVDELMIPLVNFMNKQSYLITTNCCQGYPDTWSNGTIMNKPKVIFVSLSTRGLHRLIQLLGGDPKVWSGFPARKVWEGDGWVLAPWRRVEYLLEFDDRQALIATMERMGLDD